MCNKLRLLVITVTLLLFGSDAHAVPVSACVFGDNGSQTCDLYESDASGNPSEISSVRTTVPAAFGADWVPRWVVVYKDAAMQNPSAVVQVVKSLPPVFNGLFAEEAFLYADGYANFANILQIALATPACNAENSDTSPCLLKIIENAEGVATYQQPFVEDSQNPNTQVQCPAVHPCDTINVHRLVAEIYKASTDFSSTQGFRNWYYLYGSGTQMTFVNGWWRGASNEPYMLIDAAWGHPGASVDAIRRWKAPQAGSINIVGNASDWDAGCGAGARVYIKKNSAILLEQAIANGNSAGFNFNLNTPVAAGDNIDFVFNRGTDNNWCDSTGFDPTIVFTP